jgi:hypothetical protein
MIPKFSGPFTIITPHARLLYKEFESASLAWESLMGTIIEIDELIESHPRLEKADTHCFVVFSTSSEKVWVGREIIGHRSSWPNSFKIFDTFKGEAFEWRLEGAEECPMIQEILQWKEQLTGLAPTSLAATWRMKLSPMEGLTINSNNAVGKIPNIAFQFFKSH